MKQHNFTLIELLVVIAIIAILASMLLPALNSAKAMSKQSTCANVKKQLQIASIQYGNDHKGYIVGGSIPYDSYRVQQRLFQLGYITGGSYTRFDGTKISSAGDAHEMYYYCCAQNPKYIPTTSSDTYGAGVTIGANCWFYKKKPQFFFFDKLTVPAQRMHWGDSCGKYTNAVEGGCGYWMDKLEHYGFYHSGRTLDVISYLDGHVGTVLYTQLQQDSYLKSFRTQPNKNP